MSHEPLAPPNMSPINLDQRVLDDVGKHMLASVRSLGSPADQVEITIISRYNGNTAIHNANRDRMSATISLIGMVRSMIGAVTRDERIALFIMATNVLGDLAVRYPELATACEVMLGDDTEAQPS